jgi:hypothetical protein
MIDLSQQSLEDAIIKMRDSLDGSRINIKPTTLWVYPQYLKVALRILGLIKAPIKRSSSLRKKKRNLYWRQAV